jgi:molecular chaperone GrpE
MEKEKDMDYSLMESNISKSDTSVSSQHSSPDDSGDHKLYNETLSKLKYSLADFDNFRKNIERQNSLKVLSIKADLFSAIINIREDFIRALDLIEHNKSDNGVFEGLKNILKTIDSFLEKEGIKEIESLSKVFDPNVHEIIGFSYHDNDNMEENIVTKEIRKGYLLNDRVLRPSLVEVSKKIVKNNDSVNNTKGDEI